MVTAPQCLWLGTSQWLVGALRGRAGVLKDNLLTKCHKRVRNGRARAIRTRTPRHTRAVHAIKFCAPTKNFAIDPKAALKQG